MASAQNSLTLNAVGATVRLIATGMAGYGIQITGTWTGTIVFEGSLDGINFRPLSATPIGSTTSVTSATANGLWQAAAPLVACQARMTVAGSGAAVVTLNAVPAATGGAAAGGGGGGGAVTIADGADVAEGTTTDAAVVGDNDGTVNAHLRGIDKILNDEWDSVNHWAKVSVQNTSLAVTQSGTWTVIANGGVASGAADSGNPVKVGGKYNSTPITLANGNRGDLQVDANGYVKVNIAAGASAGGTSATDMAAYTQSASTYTPIGGTYQTVITNLSDGTAAAVAMTDTRSFHVALYSNAGTAVPTGHGVAASALRVELPTDGTGQVVIAAGSAVIGHVITDTGSTTVVTGNVAVTVADGANVNQGANADAAVAAGAAGTLSAKLRSISRDLVANVSLAASSAVIGHVIADSGSTTVVTGNVTVVQPTAASLNATVIGAGSAGTANAGVVTVQGIASMTPVQVSQATASNLNAAVVGVGTAGSPSGGVLTIQGVTSMTKLLVTPDSVALPANQSVNVAQVGGTNSVTAGVGGTLAVGGNVATNVAIGTNPINLGAQAVSAENTAVTATRMAQLVTDLVGKLIVLPYANPENFVSGAITSAMTGTTSISLIAAPASGLRNYITQITISNAHASVGTDVIIQDGSGGTTLYTIPAAAVYGGATVTFPTPLRQPSTATAIYCANVTTGASVKVSASGYKGI